MTVNECIEYIHQTKWTGSKPGLSRTRELLKALGNPEKKLKFVHVVGTNGKGSASIMLSNILMKAGYSVGTFTSPFIVRFNERVKLNGVDIPDDELVKIVEMIQPVADRMADVPTEFEIITAIGMCYFAEKKCDIVILEAGMGGELDSTNVIDAPLVSPFMTIALDHMAILGDTVEKIAAAKAGILKPGTTAVIYGENADVIIEKCKKLNINYNIPDRNNLKIEKITAEGSVFSYGDFENIKLKLVGKHQIFNAITVLETVKVLREKGFVISNNNVNDALADVYWPARFEIFGRNPYIIYDGAHNDNGADALRENLSLCFPKKKFIFISGVMRDKDFTSILMKMQPFVKKMYTVVPPNPRALSAEEYAETARKCGVDAEPGGEISQELIDKALKEGDVLCMGSLYMYSAIYEYLKKAGEKMNGKVFTVAIDGPSGAGKSTIAKKVAAKYGIGHLDTGAMYRATALFMDRNIDTLEAEVASGAISEETKAKIIALLDNLDLDVVYDEQGQHTLVNGEDINGFIRNQKISMEASKVSAIPEVRVFLVEKQRKIGEKQSIIMDGRDIGTHVLPNATVKIYLTASAEERANRRCKELLAAGQNAEYETILKEIIERDNGDMTRAVSPLRQAEDAILLDTTSLDIEESVKAACDIVDGILGGVN